MNTILYNYEKSFSIETFKLHNYIKIRSLAKYITDDIDPRIFIQYYDKSIDINTEEIISVISSISNSATGYDEMPA